MKTEQYREYVRQAKKRPKNRMIKGLRKRVAKIIKERGIVQSSGRSLSKGIGCSRQELLDHIESQFEKGMSWENYGIDEGCWSIDHIKPFFMCKTEKEIIENNHWSNLRPMWHIDNITRDDYDL